MTRRIAILGSTGSIGTQTLDVIRNQPEEFEVVALSAHSSVKKLKKQVEEFQPEQACLTGETTSPVPQKWLRGKSSLEKVAGLDLDVLVLSVVGAAGLKPCLKALENNTRVALANKEVLVMAGELVKRTQKETGGEIIPVDSEHSALFQILDGEEASRVKKVVITASGGPFLHSSPRDLKDITPEEALDHPNWDMGKKISIDSATMMNKGLEIIEACYLFDLEPERVKALVHPQSAVHGFVEYVDNSLFAQCAVPDMRLPIQYALFYPERRRATVEALDLEKSFCWEFEPVDIEQFPAFGHARQALRKGKTYPAVLNAANEVAVHAFLDKKIKFLDIARLVEKALAGHDPVEPDSLEKILEVDKKTRKFVAEKVNKNSK
ncbi:MAG: 1-deoxy-D-xylulose-5-phosphate reductoisomerase [bacterium]